MKSGKSYLAILCGYICCGDEIVSEFITARYTERKGRKVAEDLLLEIVKYGELSPEEIKERYIDSGDGMGVLFYRPDFPRLEWDSGEVFSRQELRWLLGIPDGEYVWEGPSIGEVESFLPDVEVYSAFAIPEPDEF